MADPLRIMVTNDDGIDSVGLHVLARAMRPFGEVTIIAPDSEYSGASAAIGALFEERPAVHTERVEGIDTAWSVSGPPALCVFYARLGAFGPAPDLIVSGINPGANVGRSVYHSGTIGACLTGRTGGIPGIAVSQAVTDWGVEGQGWGEMVAKMKWDTAAEVAAVAVEAFLASDLPGVGVLNLNVPNVETHELAGWQWSDIGATPTRSMVNVLLEPKPGHEGSFDVKMDYGDTGVAPDPATDTGAMLDDKVSLTWLSTITPLRWDAPEFDRRFDDLVAK
ncbi:MAG: 5'/3'-nucleotidase SurE [Acidimicrobiales bacterium]